MSALDDKLQEATERQREAAEDITKAVRVVAGPGTGKSNAINMRVAWLLKNGVNPESIRVVSFTRAASDDLKTKLYRACIADGLSAVEKVQVSTLHSLAFSALGRAGVINSLFASPPTVLDEWETKNILEKEYSFLAKKTPTRAEEVREAFEAFCNTESWSPPTVVPADPPVTQEEQEQFTQFHSRRSSVYSFVLPGGLVRHCVERVDAGTLDLNEILGVGHLIVDEYQDLNPAD